MKLLKTKPYFPPEIFKRASLLYRLPPADNYEEVLLQWTDDNDLVEVFTEETSR